MNRDAQIDPDHSGTGRDHFFDPWLTVPSKLVNAVAANVSLGFSEHADTRQRRRRKQDRENLERIFETVYANLAYAVVAGFKPPTVAVPLAKPKDRQSRYERKGFRQLPRVLKWLDSHGQLSLYKSRERGRASTIEPGGWFIDMVGMLRKLTLADFGRAEGEEIIILSRSETDHAAGRRITDWVDYEDTAETCRYRAEVQRINAALVESDLAYETSEGCEPFLDIHRRTLRRVFNIPAGYPGDTIRFDLGGRLYGGWWQNLEKARRRHIRVDGEPVADLDYSNMFVRLAYHKIGAKPPKGDLYAEIKGFEDRMYREGVKRVVNALLFRTGPMMRLPRGTRAQLPQGTTAKSIRAAIIARHPDLESVFEKGIGFELMFTESRILVAALLRLIDEGVTALPMHDGLMVAASKADRAETVMGDVSEEVVGSRLPIERCL